MFPRPFLVAIEPRLDVETLSSFARTCRSSMLLVYQRISRLLCWGKINFNNLLISPEYAPLDQFLQIQLAKAAVSTANLRTKIGYISHFTPVTFPEYMNNICFSPIRTQRYELAKYEFYHIFVGSDWAKRSFWMRKGNYDMYSTIPSEGSLLGLSLRTCTSDIRFVIDEILLNPNVPRHQLLAQLDFSAPTCLEHPILFKFLRKRNLVEPIDVIGTILFKPNDKSRLDPLLKHGCVTREDVINCAFRHSYSFMSVVPTGNPAQIVSFVNRYRNDANLLKQHIDYLINHELLRKLALITLRHFIPYIDGFLDAETIERYSLLLPQALAY